MVVLQFKCIVIQGTSVSIVCVLHCGNRMPSRYFLYYYLHTMWKYDCPIYYSRPTTQDATVDMWLQPLSDLRWRCSATERVWWLCPVERTLWFSSTEHWCPGSTSPGKQEEIFKSIHRQQVSTGGGVWGLKSFSLQCTDSSQRRISSQTGCLGFLWTGTGRSGPRRPRRKLVKKQMGNQTNPTTYVDTECVAIVGLLTKNS